MDGALDGVSVKYARAKEHLDAINAATRRYIEFELSNAFTFTEIDPLDSRWQVIKFGTVPSPDPIIGAILGDFVHNVRSGLDQLMWALVKACSGISGGNHTHWPILETEGQWRDRIIKPKPGSNNLPPTHGIDAEALKLVENFQPFKLGPKGRADAPLMRLLRLSNEDKHRTLHLGMAIPAEYRTPLIEPCGYLALVGVKRPQKTPPIQEGAPFLQLKLRRVRWPPPEGVQVKVTVAPGVGVHPIFYKADGTFVAAADHLAEMLSMAERILSAARNLSVWTN